MLATLHRCALAASFSQKGAALTARLRVNRQAARSAARSLAPALAQARSFMLLPRRGGGGGDPTLTRNKYRSVIKEQLPLTLGGSLPEVCIDWEQWGDPSLPGERTVLVLPPFAHSSHAASNRDDPRPGWWENLIGPGKAIDTSYFRVICPAALGSPFSGTSPLSIDPRTGEPYRSSFPQITIADMAACHAKVLDDVGIDRVHAVVGGSMGGMQALEFAAQFPKRLERLIGVTCTHQSTPGSVAFRRVQRHAILSDPAYNDGNYPSGAVLNGMKIARELGLTCYRSREDLDQSFDWNPTGAENFNSATFDVENYMSYEAEKFARSFDPNCYLLLSKALDLMNLGRGYTNLATGTKRITCPSLIIGIKQDLLVPVEEQRNLVAILQSYGRSANLVELSSKYGHDAMFVEDAQLELLAPIVHKYIEYPIADLLPVEQHRYSSL